LNTQAKKDNVIEISVRTIFTGRRSQEQAFIDLIRQKRAQRYITNNLALAPDRDYTEIVVFPGVHAPERGTDNE